MPSYRNLIDCANCSWRRLANLPLGCPCNSIAGYAQEKRRESYQPFDDSIARLGEGMVQLAKRFV